jgi:serine/threonine-protein kinase
MGYVDLAVREEGRFRRLYAIKRSHVHHRGDAGFRAMFMDEARLAGLIRNPHVVSVHDVCEDDDGPYMVMDYVDGISLGAIISTLEPPEAPMPLALCLSVAAQVARGLHAAHEVKSEDGELLGLVHRDVSPQNILVGFDGTARVTDFGIAKAFGNVNRTATGLLKGNVGYMSPEQLRFETPDRRSDLFSLGVVLYEALARRRLYRNTEANVSARRILTEPPPDIQEIRADAPPELVQLLFELLAKERDLRPASALETAERLETVLTFLDATDGRFDLAAFLGAHFGAIREKKRGEVAAALAAASAAADTAPEADPRAAARPGTPAAPVPASIVVDVPAPAGPRAARARRRAAIALGALAAAGAAVAALALVRAPDPPQVPAPPDRAAATATAPARADPPPPVLEASPRRQPAEPEPAGAASASPAIAAAPGEETPPRARPPVRARPIATTASPASRVPPAGAGETGAAAAPEAGLVRLPRADKSGRRKLEVPIATDWQ